MAMEARFPAWGCWKLYLLQVEWPTHPIRRHFLKWKTSREQFDTWY